MALIYVQANWQDVLSDDSGSGKAWITFKERGKKGDRGYLKQFPNSDNPDEPTVTVTNPIFRLETLKDDSFTVAVNDYPLKFKITAPYQTFESIHTKSISCMDVSFGGIGISFGDDGFHVWETESGLIRRKLDGHSGDIYSVKLFPSGVVALTSGADMRLKIWSAENGTCPVTLTGHSAAVTQASIIDRGMNIVSVSKDGSLRLWSCGKQKTLEPVIELSDNVNTVDITESNLNILCTDTNDMNEDEVGTLGKLVVTGGESGAVKLIDLRGRNILNHFKLHAAVNVVKFFDENHIIAGTEDGRISIIHVPDMTLVTEIHDSDSSVQSLKIINNGIMAGKYDGACVWYPFDGNSSIGNQRIILTGSDVDPVYSIAADEDFIFTASRDGCIRKYSIHELFFR